MILVRGVFFLVLFGFITLYAHESEDMKCGLIESSDHSYSSYEPYCITWGHDYKATY